ncbi:hypothetical protein BGZ60DRAFT_355170, partial [Tricladium varicosporioides]
KTVEDAIAVAQNLGYRYLWVDKYCISQGDKEEAQRQTRAMDQIYNGSDLTIINAAGDNANYGI